VSALKLSDLKPAAGSHKAERRVGRGHGSGRGKTAGRGTKGQKARTGSNKIHRAFNGGQTRLSKRLPFKRGVGNSNVAFRDNYATFNVLKLEVFEAGSEVTPAAMAEQGLVTSMQSKGLIKVLGDGEIDHALTVHAHRFTASAQAKIEAAGGTVVLIPRKTYEQTKRRKVQPEAVSTTTAGAGE
jgi:large subunit ribosomal protein L15